MGQTGISMLNKVGYSMFWNSMWDQKIYYNRYLKEDFYLNSFFLLAFNDSFSINLLKFKKKDINLFKNYNYNVDKKKQSIYNFLLNKNKNYYFSSKLWILKYQKWLIIYHFIYILNLDKVTHKIIEENYEYKINFSYLLKYYEKSSHNFYCNYNLSKKQPFNINF